VCRTVDASGNDVTFATIESSMYKRTHIRLCQVCLPIHATPTRQSRAVDLHRWDSLGLGDAPFYRGSVNPGDGHIKSSDLYQRRTARATTYVRVVWCTSTPLRYFISYLYTVFGQHTDHSFPVAYVLMTGKQLQCIKASWKSCTH